MVILVEYEGKCYRISRRFAVRTGELFIAEDGQAQTAKFDIPLGKYHVLVPVK